MMNVIMNVNKYNGIEYCSKEFLKDIKIKNKHRVIIGQLNIKDIKIKNKHRVIIGQLNIKDIKIKNKHRVIIGQLNINSIRNKFEQLKDVIDNNIEIFMVSETKIDDTFPSAQFTLEGYGTPFLLERDADGGGLLIFVREDIPCKKLCIHSE